MSELTSITPVDPPSSVGAVVGTFLTVFTLGSAAVLGTFFLGQHVALTVNEGNFIPLLGVIGTVSAGFVGWRIIASAKRDAVKEEGK